MDGDNMNNITQSAQDIKRFTFTRMSEDKTAGIRRILGISFNDFTCIDYFFNFSQRYASAVTAPLGVPGNLKFTRIKFFPDLLKHFVKIIISNKEREVKINRVICAGKRSSLAIAVWGGGVV